MSSLILLPLVDKPLTKNQFIIKKKPSNVVNNTIDEMLGQAFEYVEDGDVSTALKLYDLILKKEPLNIRALIDKGTTLQNMGKTKLAINLYNKVLLISPNNLDVLLNKGAALHSDEQYHDAIKCYDHVLSIDKKSTMALAYKGLSLGELGHLQNAIKHFKKALSIDRYYDLANVSKDMAQELLKSIKKQKSKTL